MTRSTTYLSDEEVDAAIAAAGMIKPGDTRRRLFATFDSEAFANAEDVLGMNGYWPEAVEMHEGKYCDVEYWSRAQRSTHCVTLRYISGDAAIPLMLMYRSHVKDRWTWFIDVEAYVQSDDAPTKARMLVGLTLDPNVRKQHPEGVDYLWVPAFRL